MGATEETLSLLRSIDAGIKKLIALQSKATPLIASDRDLDGNYGNPVIKFDPRDYIKFNFNSLD